MAVFSIFRDGGSRHLGSLKYRKFRGDKSQEGQNASLCQISRQSSPRPLRLGEEKNKKRRRRQKPQVQNIMSASAKQGSHNDKHYQMWPVQTRTQQILHNSLTVSPQNLARRCKVNS